MMACRLKDDYNDVWFVLEQICDVSASENEEPDGGKNKVGIIITYNGGATRFLLNWTLDGWEAFINQFQQRMRLALKA